MPQLSWLPLTSMAMLVRRRDSKGSGKLISMIATSSHEGTTTALDFQPEDFERSHPGGAAPTSVSFGCRHIAAPSSPSPSRLYDSHTSFPRTLRRDTCCLRPVAALLAQTLFGYPNSWDGVAVQEPLDIRKSLVRKIHVVHWTVAVADVDLGIEVTKAT
ncbi:hypothetical protein BDW02DRAFT_583805 [Decorospora gaudefroyi]|uniref:Uncharacterized protein n=1 Tax=Decorospora gaudefroyi TaxID=184978 RepID=A0A6A5K4A3_9PLEO|nr:hypothetical protein BDW02DRAFT_583805 [Decorospora gaudefroyi]